MEQAVLRFQPAFRVFVLMGQSNMHGLARAADLTRRTLKNTTAYESGRMGDGNTLCRARKVAMREIFGIDLDRACRWRISLPIFGQTIPSAL